MNFNPKEHIETILDYSNRNLLEIRTFDHLKTINYSREAQYSQFWNEVTINCRGLIVDEEWNVVARSFPKFFNHDETYNKDINIYDLKDKNLTITEKLDGSLGLMFYDFKLNTWRFASKGSLNSEQSEWATDFYNNNKELFNNLDDKNRTYVFEIIYKENRIVVNYKTECLSLLTSFRNSDGMEIPTEDVDYPFKPKTYSYMKFKTMFEIQDDNEFEGFVVRYKDNDLHFKRIKFKYDYYKRVHKLRDMTYKAIYDHYMNGRLHTFIYNIIQILPDEHYETFSSAIKKLVDDVETKVDDLETKILGLLNAVEGFFNNFYDPDINYRYGVNQIELYKINEGDSIGKKIDWYLKYFEHIVIEDERIIPFIYNYIKGSTLLDKTLYDYFEPEFKNEFLFKHY